MLSLSALEQLRSLDNLHGIWRNYWSKAKRKTSSGIDGVTPKDFHKDIDFNIKLLRNEIKSGYRYSLLKGIPVPKPNSTKVRLICIPTVKDRLVQRALLKVVEGKGLELGIVNDVSYGFVKDSKDSKRGTSAARSIATRRRQEKPWVFKADIAAFFDRIPRDQLVGQLDRKFKLRSLRPLLRGAISCEVDNSESSIRRVLTQNGIREGTGLRQGMPLSPILSNFLLRDFDASFAQQGYELVRYADDFVAFADTECECKKIQDHAAAELSKLKLDLSGTKTMICNPSTPVEFLGMELCLRPENSTYCLKISDAQVRYVKENFAKYHDISFVLSRKEGFKLA